MAGILGLFSAASSLFNDDDAERAASSRTPDIGGLDSFFEGINSDIDVVSKRNAEFASPLGLDTNRNPVEIPTLPESPTFDPEQGVGALAPNQPDVTSQVAELLAGSVAAEISTAIEDSQPEPLSGTADFLFKPGGFTERKANEELKLPSQGPGERADNRNIRSARSRLGFQDDRVLDAMLERDITPSQGRAPETPTTPVFPGSPSGLFSGNPEESVRDLARSLSTQGPAAGAVPSTNSIPGGNLPDAGAGIDGPGPRPNIFSAGGYSKLGAARGRWRRDVMAYQTKKVDQQLKYMENNRRDQLHTVKMMSGGEKIIGSWMRSFQLARPNMPLQERMNHPRTREVLDQIHSKMGEDALLAAVMVMDMPTPMDMFDRDKLMFMPKLQLLLESGMDATDAVKQMGEADWELYREGLNERAFPLVERAVDVSIQEIDAVIKQGGRGAEYLRNKRANPKTQNSRGQFTPQDIQEILYSDQWRGFSDETFQALGMVEGSLLSFSPSLTNQLDLVHDEQEFKERQDKRAQTAKGVISTLQHPDTGVVRAGVQGSAFIQSLLDQGFVETDKLTASRALPQWAVTAKMELIQKDGIALDFARTVAIVDDIYQINPHSGTLGVAQVMDFTKRFAVVTDGLTQLYDVATGKSVRRVSLKNADVLFDTKDEQMASAQAGGFEGVRSDEANSADKDIREGIVALGIDVNSKQFRVMRAMFWELAYTWALTKGQKGRSVSDKDIAIAASVLGKDISNPEATRAQLAVLTENVWASTIELRNLYIGEFGSDYIKPRTGQWFAEKSGYVPFDRNATRPLRREGLPPGPFGDLSFPSKEDMQPSTDRMKADADAFLTPENFGDPYSDKEAGRLFSNILHSAVKNQDRTHLDRVIEVLNETYGGKYGVE